MQSRFVYTSYVALAGCLETCLLLSSMRIVVGRIKLNKHKLQTSPSASCVTACLAKLFAATQSSKCQPARTQHRAFHIHEQRCGSYLLLLWERWCLHTYVPVCLQSRWQNNLSNAKREFSRQKSRSHSCGRNVYDVLSKQL